MTSVDPEFVQISEDRYDHDVVARFAKRCRVAAAQQGVALARSSTKRHSSTSEVHVSEVHVSTEGEDGEQEGQPGTQVEGEGHEETANTYGETEPCHEWVHESKHYRMFKRAKFIDNLSRIISKMCDRIHAQHDDDIDALRTLTRKYSRPFSASKIYKNLDQFLQQISAEVNFETSCFVNVLVYLSRLMKNPNFVLTWFSVHRVVLTCIMVADKTIDDIHSSTSRYAWISGTKKRHLCRMERKFMSLIDFNAFVMAEDFHVAEQYLMNVEDFDAPLPDF